MKRFIVSFVMGMSLFGGAVFADEVCPSVDSIQKVGLNSVWIGPSPSIWTVGYKPFHKYDTDQNWLFSILSQAEFVIGEDDAMQKGRVALQGLQLVRFEKFQDATICQYSTGIPGIYGQAIGGLPLDS